MKFKLITPDGPEYDAERMLRWEVLAKPLGIPPEMEEGAAAQETGSLHLIALDGKKLVGCVCFHPEGQGNGRIFEMAVSEEYRGQGFGRQLLHTLEKTLVQHGIKDVYLFAPPDAEQFYSLMGYQPEEEILVKSGITQRKMKKNLQNNE
jgi:N-acetylglutamate synthase-like GNAT family acetyltransferase